MHSVDVTRAPIQCGIQGNSDGAVEEVSDNKYVIDVIFKAMPDLNNTIDLVRTHLARVKQGTYHKSSTCTDEEGKIKKYFVYKTGPGSEFEVLEKNETNKARIKEIRSVAKAKLVIRVSIKEDTTEKSLII